MMSKSGDVSKEREKRLMMSERVKTLQDLCQLDSYAIFLLHSLQNSGAEEEDNNELKQDVEERDEEQEEDGEDEKEEQWNGRRSKIDENRREKEDEKQEKEEGEEKQWNGRRENKIDGKQIGEIEN